MPKPLRVCYFGAYRGEYARNVILIEGLRRAGVEVIECHEQLWRSIQDRVETVSGGWRRPVFWWRIGRAYVRLLYKYFTICTDYDVLLVGYPGQFDVLLARLLTWLRRKPLVWDICMSIYLITLERGLARPNQFVMRFLRWFEWVACRLPERLLIDTAAYADWFARERGVALPRFRLTPIGADNDRFHPSSLNASPAHPADQCFRVLYYGSYIPNHGVEYIIEAAHRLADDPTIHFEMIGHGPERYQAMALAVAYGLTNITFIDWMDPSALKDRLAAADVTLGAFGVTPQSLLTIHNKVLEGLAMAKPVIHGDGPAVRQALRHGEEIFLCERTNAAALAAAIRTLHDDPALRQRLATNGHARFLERYTIERLGETLKQHLLEVIEDSGR
jgi:glycosyltransferase involved in cell wall biosynthesis